MMRKKKEDTLEAIQKAAEQAPGVSKPKSDVSFFLSEILLEAFQKNKLMNNLVLETNSMV